MSPFVGDITKFDDVSRCLKGASAVIHTCAVISVGTFPDKEKVRLVNVEGNIT